MNYSKRSNDLTVSDEKKENHFVKSKDPGFGIPPYAYKKDFGSAKISVPVFDGLQMLNTDDIIKCVAHESYTEIVLFDGSSLMVSRLLKEYEDTLSMFNFLRIHNSHLVNLRHVKKYIKGEGGYVIMCDGVSCEVSRRKKAELLQRLTVVNL